MGELSTMMVVAKSCPIRDRSLTKFPSLARQDWNRVRDRVERKYNGVCYLFCVFYVFIRMLDNMYLGMTYFSK